MTGRLITIAAAVLISAAAMSDNSKILLNQAEVAYIGVYNSPDNSARWIKSITRKQLNTCLNNYTTAQKKKTRYVNHCLCRLKFGAKKCNL